MSDAIPNLGTLLAPYLSAVPAASMPRFLARLERGAADRYRYWASVLPAHAPGLLECAAREDEIARRADALFAVIAEDLPAIEAALPQARSTYFQIFDGLEVPRQLQIQASAEREGNAAWLGLADGADDVSAKAELVALAALEIDNAEYLEQVVEALA